jgi:hypothetical protein
VQFQTNEMVPQPGGGFGYETKHTIRLYDVESGSVMWENISAARCQGFQFSPDGHNLAVINADGATTIILEGATGKERAHLEGNGIMPVFSEDGRFLAIGDVHGGAQVFDLRTAKDIAAFHGHEGRVAALAFSADANTLFTGGAEGTTLAWDLRERVLKARKTGELDTSLVKELWADIGDADAAKAFGAMNALAASPRRTVEWLNGQLKPVRGEDANRIARLIKDLDDDSFTIRRNAFDSLAKIGNQARPALVNVLKGETSLEVRQAVTGLLDLTGPGQLSPDLVRDVRALEVLESIGTPEARRIIEKIAKGASGTRLTAEAEAALERWTKSHPEK